MASGEERVNRREKVVVGSTYNYTVYSNITILVHLIDLFSGVIGVEDTIKCEKFRRAIFDLGFPQLNLPYIRVHV